MTSALLTRLDALSILSVWTWEMGRGRATGLSEVTHSVRDPGGSSGASSGSSFRSTAGRDWAAERKEQEGPGESREEN